MEAQGLEFTVGHPDFYDVPWSVDAVDPGPSLLPAAAQGDTRPRTRSGPWLVVGDPTGLPSSGWKIHVSASPAESAQVVALVDSVCRRLGVVFKTLATPRLVLANLGKHAPRESSGKIVTAYPPAPLLAVTVAELRTALLDRPGPPIANDIRISRCPVGLRHGSFAQVWTTDAAGTPIPGLALDGIVRPDRRGRKGDAPALPEDVLELLADPPSGTLDIHDVRLVHRSNAGAVYRATWTDGRRVVIKEARRHTGLDRGGTDAVARLRHEALALQRCSGSGVTAEPVDYVDLGESELLVMDCVEGITLTRAMVARHPACNPERGAAESSVPAYADWVEQIRVRLRSAVSRIHERGVVHGDIHPDNVLLVGDRLVLIDFESAGVDGVVCADGIAARGFSDPEQTGVAADLGAVERTADTLLQPQTPLLRHRPDLAVVLRDAARADLGLSVHPDPQTGTDAPAIDVRRVLAGMRLVRQWHRSDRLYPGGVEQFAAPRAGLGLMHGAAGVCLAEAAVNGRPDEQALAWLEVQARASGPWPRGLADGLDGVALALALCGREAAAAHVLDKSRDDDVRAPWWGTGAAGCALVAAELGEVFDDSTLRVRARRHTASVVAALKDPSIPSGYAPGLVRGWAGIALSLLRIAQVSDDLREACLFGAGIALDRELPALREVGAGLFAVDGPRLSPALGVGSAAAGLAAGALLAADETDATDAATERTQELRRVIEDVAHALRSPVIMQGGLLTGRSGIALTLARLVPADPMVSVHRQRLSWHTVPAVHSRTLADTPGANDADLVLGEHLHRFSADLATGSAGLLLALRPELAADVLRLPSDVGSVVPQQVASCPGDMTSVTSTS